MYIQRCKYSYIDRSMEFHIISIMIQLPVMPSPRPLCCTVYIYISYCVLRVNRTPLIIRFHTNNCKYDVAGIIVIIGKELLILLTICVYIVVIHLNVFGIYFLKQKLYLLFWSVFMHKMYIV